MKSDEFSQYFMSTDCQQFSTLLTLSFRTESLREKDQRKVCKPKVILLFCLEDMLSNMVIMCQSMGTQE